MRVGCFGRLVATGLLVGSVGAVGWVIEGVLEEPVRPLAPDTVDATRVQQKIYDAIRHRTGPVTIVLTEAEVNAFLLRHLDITEGSALSSLSLRLTERDIVEVTGQLPLGRALARPPMTTVRSALPAAWLTRPVWINLRGRPVVDTAREDGRGRRATSRYVRLDVKGLWLGRQRVPVGLTGLILEPDVLAGLRWRAPAALEAISVEPGRVVIRAASRDAS
jgi:hypothetical protein